VKLQQNQNTEMNEQQDEVMIESSNATTKESTPTSTTASMYDTSRRKSTMVKVSNLSKQITEGQVYELFSSCGIINRIKMEMVIPPNVSHTSCVIE
jgi:RNA recognition motif-containing protein